MTCTPATHRVGHDIRATCDCGFDVLVYGHDARTRAAVMRDHEEGR